MNKEEALEEIRVLIEEGNKILATKSSQQGYDLVDRAKQTPWHSRILTFLSRFPQGMENNIVTVKRLKNSMIKDVQGCIGVLINVRDYIEKGFFFEKVQTEVDVDANLDRIFTKFHRITKQLCNRYGGRETLKISDEYDVQDLLHSLLHLYYDDIRAEEWTPSYAGSSARVDFLLKNEKVVIEVKKTRAGLTDKEVGNQLIEDIERYQIHPDCQRLICFVYDPEGRIQNPIGVMGDLNSRHEGFAKVVIKPDI